jgi:alpha-beta hydrolase superfamily lysophospholipase
MATPDDLIELATTDGHSVRGDLYLPEGRPPRGLVLLCHGFKGYKSWGFFPFLAGRLRESGIAALSMDFSFNGTFPAKTAPSTPLRFPRPDLFRLNTIERECTDLRIALDAVRRDGIFGRLPPRIAVGVFGHSRGAVAATVNASEQEGIRVLCTWSAPAHPDHFTRAQKERWRRWGEYDFTDAVDGAELSLSAGYLDDLEANRERYDLIRRASTLRTPHLIVHGSVDLAVSADSAWALYEAEKHTDDKRILILQSGHTFGVSDPPGLDSERPPRALVDACEASVDWFGSHLEREGRGT